MSVVSEGHEPDRDIKAMEKTTLVATEALPSPFRREELMSTKNIYETPYGRLSSRAARAVLAEAQNHRCCYCGRPMIEPPQDGPYPYHPRHASIEHITPLSRGGFHDYENLAVACAECNCQRPADMLAIVWFYKISSGASTALIKSQHNNRPKNVTIAANRDKMLRQEEARRRWVAAIKETQRQRAQEAKKAGAIVATSASGEIVAVFNPLRVTAPHGKPRDCNFDPATRPAPAIKKPPKREEPAPLEKMSKAHRRRVKLYEQAIAPMMTA